VIARLPDTFRPGLGDYQMDRVLDRRCGAGEALSLLRRRAGRGPRPRRLLLAGTALAGALMLAPSRLQACLDTL
jgi:hypothetical protein